MRSRSTSTMLDRTSRLLPSILNADIAKRVADVGGAVVALIICSPILVLCAVAIRLGGAPSFLFCQERIGRNGQPFKMFKLATMKGDAHLTGPLLSTARDERVTRIGRIIRPCRVNELPQFVNVLRGEMSIVGPRPEVPKFVRQWAPVVKEQILSARPGITGLSTLHFSDEGFLLEGRDDIELAYVQNVLPKKLRIDVWYVTHRTFWLDLRIVLLTLVKVLGGSRFFHSSLRETELALKEGS